MPGIAPADVREQLLVRRAQLAAVMRPDTGHRFVELLQEVDAALERVDAGSYGVCEVCHDAIEAHRLTCDPLVRVCLGCLSPDQARLLERDLEAAARIQAGLLPARELAHDGWQIAYHYAPLGPVSGDYCDIIRPDQPAGDLHVVFGDVAGKGVSASLLMTHLHAMFRALVALDLPLAELVARANRLFSESTLPHVYATLVVGRLSASGDVELTNLAHCPPLVVAGGSVRSLPPTGYPLGLFPSGTIETRSFQLAQGDQLFLYTDGLSEAENDRGEEYGEQRILRVVENTGSVPPPGTIRACLDDFTTFRNGASSHDDLTLMAVRRAYLA